MRLLVSCVDSGSIKEVLCNIGTDTSVQSALQPFHVAPHLAEGLKAYVDRMWVISEDEAILARNSGVVELVKFRNTLKKMKLSRSIPKEKAK